MMIVINSNVMARYNIIVIDLLFSSKKFLKNIIM